MFTVTRTTLSKPVTLRPPNLTLNIFFQIFQKIIYKAIQKLTIVHQMCEKYKVFKVISYFNSFVLNKHKIYPGEA